MASISSIQQVQVLKLHSAMHIALQQQRSEFLHSLLTRCCSSYTQSAVQNSNILTLLKRPYKTSHPYQLPCMVRAYHSVLQSMTCQGYRAQYGMRCAQVEEVRI